MIKVTKEIAKDGNTVLKVEFNEMLLYLSSRYFPLEDAERLSVNFNVKNPTLVIVGLGNPYLVYALSRKNVDKEILVIEPIEEIFKVVNSDRSLKSLVSSSNVNVKLVYSEEELKRVLSEISYFDYYIHPQYKVFFPTVQKWEIILKSTLHNLEINRNTLRKFGNVWVKNFILSFENVFKAKGVKNLFGMFEGIPCIIVGAGPSLDKDIKLVKELENFLIISVDTSWSYLVSNGIKPDFVVTVDPQLKNFLYNIIEKEYSKTLFVCDSMYSPIIYKFVPFENIFVFNSPFKVWGFLKENFGIDKGDVMVGGSVICSAIDLANKLGCEYIFLSGVDLCFPNMRLYFKGNYYEVYSFLKSNVFYPYDQWNILSKYPLVERFSKNGNRVLTDPRMLTFKEWIENYISKSNIKVGNISYEGLSIENTLDLDVLSVVKGDERKYIERVKEEALNLPNDNVNGNIVSNLKSRIFGIIRIFNDKGINEVLEVLKNDEFLKFIFELSLQSVLLSDYTEEDFINALLNELRYVNKLMMFDGVFRV